MNNDKADRSAHGANPVFLPCLLGPTGIGKSAAALALTDILPLSVINADSRQIYRDFPIITAQPPDSEQKRCPHLLYGFLPTQDKLGAGGYARLAQLAIEKTHVEGRQALCVGGSGLYFRALLEGLAPVPTVPEDIAQRWRETCRLEGSEALHARLCEIDPDYAKKIHPKDRQRVCRALEVFEATGKTFTWWHIRQMPAAPYRALKIGLTLPMPELEKRLARRIDLMLEQGALEEARVALENCPDPAAPGWSGIGCAEIFRFLHRDLSLDECRALWLKNSRAYAKRQNTWFRADKEIIFFHPQEIDKICEYILHGQDGNNFYR